MRSGTTSLARYLGAHPDVFVPAEKEIHFFDRYFEKGVGWYQGRFSRASNEIALGEATQSYMYDPSAVKRMEALLPSSRLIAILRHPTNRAYSHYWLNRALGQEPLSFEDALDQESDRLTMSRRSRFVYSYVDRGRYVRQLESVCDGFPRSSICVLIFEEMRTDPATTYEAACRHIGVDPGRKPVGLGKRINAHVTYRSPSLRRYSKKLPRSLRAAVGRLNVRQGEYEPMQEKTRARLNAMFHAEIEELSDWLGQEIPSWGHANWRELNG